MNIIKDTKKNIKIIKRNIEKNIEIIIMNTIKDILKKIKVIKRNIEKNIEIIIMNIKRNIIKKILKIHLTIVLKDERKKVFKVMELVENNG